MDLLRHLELFVAVTEHRHFGHAASAVGMTQPPLSQAVQRLERHLGVRLLDRNARHVRLTAPGRAVLPHAQDLLDRARSLHEAAREGARATAPLRIGLVPELGRLGIAMVGALNATTQRSVDSWVAASTSLVDDVADGRLDLAVVRHPGVVDGVESGPVLRLPTLLLTAPGTPTRLREIRVPLATAPRHAHPAAHDQLVDTLRRHGHDGATITAPSSIAAQISVAAGTAFALTCDAPPHGLVASEVESDGVPIRVRVVHGRLGPLPTGELQGLAEVIEEVVDAR